MRKRAEERFWSHVKKSDDPEGCWEWVGGKGGNYGMFHPTRETAVGAHRFSWELHNGSIPKGLYVCHDCPNGDNPICVNPKHLFLGTQKDNLQDMVKKGRCGGKPLSEETRRKISEALKGKSRSPHTEEWNKKISVSLTGERHPMFGKHCTLEAKEKMRQTRLKNKLAKEAKE